jgi:putative transposase
MKKEDFTYRFRLYPTEEQQDFLDREIGCLRFVYNEILSRAKKGYEKNSRKWNIYEYKKLLPQPKEEFPFLKEANSQALQQSIFDLDIAFKNFFTHQSGFPNFKKKKNSGSIHIPQHFTIENDKLYIPKLKKLPINLLKRSIDYKGIKMKLHRDIEGAIKSITITKTLSGKFFVSILVEKEIKQLPKTDTITASDVGIKAFTTISKTSLNNLNERMHEKVNNPKYLFKSEKRLKKLQKQLSRKQHKRIKTDTNKASNNYKKYAFKVAKLHEHIANERIDFLHNLSRRIIDENPVIILEDLNIKGIVKNHHLAKSISDASWGTLIKFLTYKSDWYGRTIIQFDRFYPSSQTCSVYGYRNSLLKNLSIREWTCPVCGTHYDRDENASAMLLKEGLRIIGQELPEFMPVEKSSVDDRKALPCLKSIPSMKQEATHLNEW